MKRLVPVLLALLSFSLLCLPAFADIIPPDSHYVERCVKIANLGQYPSIVVITQDLNLAGDVQTLSIAKSGECLPATSYKFDPYKIYWASKSYADSVRFGGLKLKNASYDSSSIDDANVHFITSSISPNGHYVDNSMRAEREEVLYVLQQDSAGGYVLVKQAAPGRNNGTLPPSPAVPSAPSKPTPPAPALPSGAAEGPSSILYMLLVLALGAAAIFIIIKSMQQARPKSMPPAHPGQPEPSSRRRAAKKKA